MPIDGKRQALASSSCSTQGGGPIAAASDHLPVLDGVRGLAILLVLICHFFQISHPATALEDFLTRLTRAGVVGVDLFFVLSGFLITRLLLKHRLEAHVFRNFYVRRILRIVPAYYVLLFVQFYILPAVLGANTPAGLRALGDEQGYYWAYLQNWLIGTAGFPNFDILNHTWSLAIEEQFYLAWPLLVILLRPTVSLRVAGAAVLAASVARFVYCSQHASWILIYVNTITRIDSLAVGGCLALVLHERTMPRHLPKLAWATLLVGMPLSFRMLVIDRRYLASPDLETYGYLVLALVFGAIITLALKPDTLFNCAFQLKPLRQLGKYSYGIYLLHWPASVGVSKALGGYTWLPAGTSPIVAGCAGLVFGSALSIAAGLISWHLIERPALKLKERFTYAPPRAEAAPTQRTCA